MYDTNKTLGYDLITAKMILSKVSEYQIYSFYIGDFKTGVTFSSPLREDNVPSFRIWKSRGGRMYHRDYATDVQGDCFSFVQQKFLIGFDQALKKINNDLHLGYNVKPDGALPITHSVILPDKVIPVQKGSKIGIKKQMLTMVDINYWKGYGIDVDMLKFYNTFSCKWVFLNDKKIWFYNNGNPIYGYLFFKDDKYSWKIYRPYGERKAKWLSNVNRTILQGWDQLPKSGELLVITKSLKDVMVLRTFGIASVAMQTETSVIKDTVVDELYNRFGDIYILQDFDLAGVKGVNALRKAYGFKPVFIQNFKTRSNGMKDISDYRKEKGFEDTKLLMKNLIEKWK